MNKIYSLLLGELSKKRILCFMLTQIVGVAIVVISVQFFFDVRKALEKTTLESEYIILTKKVGTLSGLFSSNLSFSNDEINEIKDMDGIGSVGDFTSSNFRVQAGVSISSRGMGYTTEMFFESVDAEYIDVKSDRWTFTPNSKEIPIIVPKNYINLYNFGFAPATGLPKLSDELIQSIKLDITVYDHMGNSHSFNGYVVGFSSRINTILAPKEFVVWGNETFTNKGKTDPNRLIASVDPKQSESILSNLKSNGYEIENKVFDYETVSKTVTFIVSVTLFIGIIITIMSLILLVLSLFLLIERNRIKIFNLFILGFPLKSIFRPYMKATLLLSSCSFVLAYILSLLARQLYLPTMTEYLGVSNMGSNIWIPLIIVLGLYITVVGTMQIIILKELRSIRK